MPTSARLPTNRNRAMAGLSMGGMETKMITLTESRHVLSHWPVQRRVDFPGRCQQHARFQGEGQARIRQLRQQGSWRRNRGGRRGRAVIPRRIPTRSRKLASTATITCLPRRPTSGSRGGEASVNLRRCCSKSSLSRPPHRDLPRPARRSPRPRRRLFASMPAGSRPLPIRRAKSGRRIKASKEATRSIVIRTR